MSVRTELEKWFHRHPDQYQDYMITAMLQENPKQLREGADVFIKCLIAAVDKRELFQLDERISMIRSLSDRIEETVQDNPGLFIQKGRLDVACQLYMYFRQTSFDTEWIVQLQNKYDRASLVALYQHHTLSMSELAEKAGASHPSYMTEVVDRLQELGFIERDKRGRNVYCRLTSKGMLAARSLAQAHSDESQPDPSNMAKDTIAQSDSIRHVRHVVNRGSNVRYMPDNGNERIKKDISRQNRSYSEDQSFQNLFDAH